MSLLRSIAALFVTRPVVLTSSDASPAGRRPRAPALMLLALVAMLALGETPAAAAPPANDNFVDAQGISGASGTASGTNVDATTEPGEPDHVSSGGASIWYDWTAPADGDYAFDTCASTFDTLLAVYTGPVVGSLTQVASNDDSSCGTRSEVTFPATGGTEYHLAVDGFGAATGAVVLDWAQVPPPANDNFAAAEAISGPSGSVVGTNRGATAEAGEPVHAAIGAGRSVWYVWTAPSSGEFLFDTCGSGIDTVLAVYTGPALAGLVEVASNDDAPTLCGPQAGVTFTAAVGQEYRIAVDGKSTAVAFSGATVLTWVPFVPPANDDFANAASISGPGPDTITSSNVGATEEAGEPDHAGVPGGRSIWYRWTAPADGLYLFHTCSSSFDTALAVYTGTQVDGLTAVASSDDADELCPPRSGVTFSATVGTEHLIAIDGKGGAMGTTALHWEQIPPPDNDNFAAARQIADPSGVDFAANVAATKEPGEPSHGGDPGGASIWWTWPAPASGEFTFDTCGADFDTVLAVYTGSDVGALTPVASSDDAACAPGSRVVFTAVGGAQYRIAVDGKGGVTGTVPLEWQPFVAPPNDNLAAAEVISGLSGAVGGSNVAATKEAGEPLHAGNAGGASIWYQWTAPETRLMRFDTCFSAIDTLLAVYTGDTVPTLAPIASDDDGCGPQSSLTFPATAGTIYRIAVDGRATGAGPGMGSVSLEWDPVPSNDAFAAAEAISGPSGTVAGSNEAATKESGEPIHAGDPGGQSIWYVWTPPWNGTVTFETCESDFDTLLAVYTGGSVVTLTEVVSNDDSVCIVGSEPTRSASRVTFTATVGEAYHLAIDGAVNSEESPDGTSVLEWQMGPVAAPTISTQATPAMAAVGVPVHDVAVVAGGNGPTGTVTFALYSDAACTTSVFVDSQDLIASGATSADHVPTALGTYYWVAAYSGDPNNAAVSGACGDPNEQVVVGPIGTTIDTQATPATAFVGDPVHDVATVVGVAGVIPTGNVTFTLYNDPNCAIAVFSDIQPLSGGSATSADFVPVVPGTYLWIAAYGGDASHAPVSGACGAPNESVVISAPTTTTSTTVPSSTTTTSTTLPSSTTTTSTSVPPSTTTTSTTVPPSTTTTSTTIPAPTTTTSTTVPSSTTTTSTTVPSSTTTTSTTVPSSTTTTSTTVPSSTTTTSTTVPSSTTTTSTTVPSSTTTTSTTVPSTTTTTSTTVPSTTTTTSTTIPPSTTTTSTSIPPAVTTPEPPPTEGPPPTTAPPITTLTPAITTTTPIATTPITTTPITTTPITTAPTTTVPPPTTVPRTTTTAVVATPPTSVPPTLLATTPAQRTGGPPGVALNVAGGGYGACETVYFFFDDLRIGSAEPDANGFVDRAGLSIPGQAKAGEHTVSTSCDRYGKQVLTSTQFEVSTSELHRSALMTSLPQPRDISLDPARLALSALVALGFVLLIAFPFHLFNSTFEENYEEIRTWFGLSPRPHDYEPRHHRWLLLAFLASAGVLCAALSSDFGFNRTTLVTSVGMSVAILITGLGFAIPTVIYMRRRYGEWGRLKILPGSILVAVVTVVISRLVGFETPGYVYGLLGVFIFHNTLSRERQGRLTTLTSLFVLAVCLGAWFARAPISAMADDADPALWTLVLELLLGGIFLLGLESLVVDLFPLRYLDGSRITAWSRVIWTALFAAAVFVLVHVLLSPGSGYVGKTENLGVRPVVIGLFVGFGLFSLAFWAYFRYRPSRETAGPGERLTAAPR